MKKRAVWLALLVLAFGTGFLVLRRKLGLDFDPESMQVAIADMGLWAPLAYVGIVAFRVPLGLPSQIVLIGGGLVFGAVSGTLYGALGILLSAVFLFLTARWTGRDAIERRMPLRLRPLFQAASTRAGGAFVALGTGYPFGPITLYHVIAGVTGMAVATFVVAVALGAMLRSAMYTFFGSRLLSGDPTAIALATGVIATAVVVPLLFPRSREWILRGYGRAPSAPTGAPGRDGTGVDTP